MMYPINEIFYTLQGEGLFAGEPMLFIRFYGCNLNCYFCDTPDRYLGEFSAEHITHKLTSMNINCRQVVLTGGEPAMQELPPLLTALKKKQYTVHIETNGTLPLPDFTLDSPIHHICVSPKQITCDRETVQRAHVIKFLCGLPGWDDFIWEFLREYNPEGQLLLMPLAAGQREMCFTKSIQDIDQDNTQEAVRFCLEHPDFRFTPQLHKYLNIS